LDPHQISRKSKGMMCYVISIVTGFINRKYKTNF
jgi:hypothetical protein